MSRVVLDASSVTAVLRKERGYENVLPHLRGSVISSVNLAEVFCTSRSRNADPEHDEFAINMMQLQRIPFDGEQARVVSSIYMSTLGSTVGLAGRVCLGLGLLHKLPVLTAESDWLKHNIDVEIILFRNTPL